MSEEGLSWALEQLQAVERQSEQLLRIRGIERRPFESFPLEVEISLHTRHLQRGAGGCQLRDRERLTIAVPNDFPFRLPVVLVRHRRFAGLPHVQWNCQICLYLSPSTEWNPADGMFGFLERIEEWLSRAALNTLVEIDGPIHPPIAYISRRLGARAVVIAADTPSFDIGTWTGVARIKLKHDQRVDICGWLPAGETVESDEIAGCAILLSSLMPFEYPSSFQDLTSCLKAAGISTKELLISLGRAARQNAQIYPLYVVIGAPMRQMPGSGARRQHLAVWYLREFIVSLIKKLVDLIESGEESKVDEIIASLETGEKTAIEWCRVLEARPEVTIRRDEETPMSWFKDKTVTVLGAGALGANVCELLTRAGVKKLRIYDNKLVSPGVLVRQPFIDSDIGKTKVDALRARLRQIRKNLEVDHFDSDVLKRPLDSDDWTDGADLLIDATANVSVLAKLESARMAGNTRIPSVSMVIGSKAERGLVVTAGSDYSGGVLDVSRKAKLAACRDPGLSEFLSEFWNSKAQVAPFQPEPGCSESTFVGSAADVVTLAGMMINMVARDLAHMESAQATAHFVSQPWLNNPENISGHFTWAGDKVLSAGGGGYEIRIEPGAQEEMNAWIRQSGRTAGSVNETGGVLFGELNSACRIVWLTEITGPPADSTASPTEFICGVDGVEDVNKEKRKNSLGSIHFVGLWHTHPNSIAMPSAIDLNSVLQLLHEKDSGLAKMLMLIAAGNNGNSQLGCGVFKREQGQTQWLIAK
ncbi:MAG TPA: ThiF family adenylyltransferase [Oculatellaceae cyanobacterium]